MRWEVRMGICSCPQSEIHVSSPENLVLPNSPETAPSHTPTGNGLGLDSSVLAPPLRQRSKRPCSRLIKPVYQ